MKMTTTAPLAAVLVGLCVAPVIPSALAAEKDLTLPPDSHKEVTTRYTGSQVSKWETQTIDGKSYRVSPPITFGRRVEINHFRITTRYSGAGSVGVSTASTSILPRFDRALKFKRRPVTVRNGVPVTFVHPYRSGDHTWILLSTTGAVRIASITLTCLRGTGTIYGHEAGSFEFASATLPFRLMYPRNYDPRKSYPLVLSVSGSGGVGNDNSRSMEMVILARYLFLNYYHDKAAECFSLVPQIPSLSTVPAPYYPKGRRGAPTPTYHPDWPAVNEGSWYTDATLALIQRLIADRRVNIDPDRVYYTGFSYGGKATWEFLRAGRTAFAAALCGAGWPIGRAYSNPNEDMLKRLRLEISRHKHIPVWIFAGEKDPMRFGSRAIFKELKAAGAKVQYLECPSATHVASAGRAWGSRKHIAWLFTQNRKNNPAPAKDPYPGGVYPAGR